MLNHIHRNKKNVFLVLSYQLTFVAVVGVWMMSTMVASTITQPIDVDDIANLDYTELFRQIRTDQQRRRQEQESTTITSAAITAQVKSQKMLINPKLGGILSDMYVAATTSSVESREGILLQNTKFLQQYIHTVNDVDYIVVDVIGNDKRTIRLTLESNGYKVINCFDHACSVDLPVSQLQALSQLSQVKLVSKSVPQTMKGKVTSEGDTAMYSNIARARYNVNGTGLTVGVLSDSFNCLGGAAQDIRTGDLPPLSRINVIKDDNSYCTDEGRAMMQIIHDVAPGARLAFYTAFVSEVDFASGILALRNAGCDIIVDDVIYFREPMYQDGIVAQAVQRVVQSGTPYFVSAGNYASDSWEASKGFVKSGIMSDIGEYHSFGTDSSGKPILDMNILLPNNDTFYTFIFQWAETYLSANGKVGSKSDIDITIVAPNGELIPYGTDFNVGADPIELIFFVPSDYGSTKELVDFSMSITLYSGPPPKHMKLIVLGGRTGAVKFEYGIGSATSFGHQNTAWGASVGAASFNSTPAYRVSPPRAEPFTSRGGIPIFYNASGSPFRTPKIRMQPRFVGPDGGLTTFFGRNNRFYGTSAAAPHVAAVAALLLERAGGKKRLAPGLIYRALQDTAIDMDDNLTASFDVGFDFLTGYGFVNASAAIARVPASAPRAPVPAPRTPVTAPRKTRK